MSEWIPLTSSSSSDVTASTKPSSYLPKALYPATKSSRAIDSPCTSLQEIDSDDDEDTDAMLAGHQHHQRDNDGDAASSATSTTAGEDLSSSMLSQASSTFGRTSGIPQWIPSSRSSLLYPSASTTKGLTVTLGSLSASGKMPPSSPSLPHRITSHRRPINSMLSPPSAGTHLTDFLHRRKQIEHELAMQHEATSVTASTLSLIHI